VSLSAKLRESVCEKEKKTIKGTKRKLTSKQNKTHTYVKNKKIKINIKKITFFLEKQNMKRRGENECI
jgi:hypothetical protein